MKEANEKVVGVCIGFLTDDDNNSLPEIQLQDVFNLLLDNPSSISKEEWPVFINELAVKHHLVLQRINNFDEQSQKHRRELDNAVSEA